VVIFHRNTQDAQHRLKESQESFGGETEDAKDIDYANFEHNINGLSSQCCLLLW